MFLGSFTELMDSLVNLSHPLHWCVIKLKQDNQNNEYRYANNYLNSLNQEIFPVSLYWEMLETATLLSIGESKDCK